MDMRPLGRSSSRMSRSLFASRPPRQGCWRRDAFISRVTVSRRSCTRWQARARSADSAGGAPSCGKLLCVLPDVGLVPAAGGGRAAAAGGRAAAGDGRRGPDAKAAACLTIVLLICPELRPPNLGCSPLCALTPHIALRTPLLFAYPYASAAQQGSLCDAPLRYRSRFECPRELA